jgi:hypothetical protein
VFQDTVLAIIGLNFRVQVCIIKSEPVLPVEPLVVLYLLIVVLRIFKNLI